MPDLNDAEAAVWRFFYLVRLMQEAPISVQQLSRASGVSTAVITRMRGGKLVKRNTAIKIFDAMASLQKYAGKLAQLKNDLILRKDARCAFDIDAFLASI